MPAHALKFIMAVVVAICATANAQNALGDGRALDNSLNIRSRYNSARPSIASELAFRNSIVTGNAPGGLSFRGDVGYRAPGEFGGELGANDLFSFRRDSLRSGMAGMGIRGTEALQYQLALTTGNRPPANLVGRYSIRRFGTGVPAGDVLKANTPDYQPGLSQRPAIDPDADDRGTLLWMLRSPSAYMSNSALQASAMRQVKGADSKIYTMTASPLRGVRLSPVPGITENRAAAGSDDSAAEPGDRPGTGEPTSAPGTEGSASPTDPPVRTLHGEILRRLNEREDALSAGPTITDRVREILGQLAARRAANEADEAEESGEPVETRSAATDRIHFDPETMRLLHGDGTPLTDYVNPADVNRDVYAEHMHAGQDLMAEGRYFDAEERFAQALAIRRGDVTAQIARFHAQIGAGLFLSASLNMQSLALSRPEVFAVKYAEQLVPSRQRLEDLSVVLRETMDFSTDLGRKASPQVRQGAGLLLAYIGFQLDRKAQIEEGLDHYISMATRDLAPGEPLPIEARLGEMFRAMWLIDDQAAKHAEPADSDAETPDGDTDE